MRRPTYHDREAADQEFFEKNRKLSPRYPDIAGQLARQRRARETIAARMMLWGVAPGGLLLLHWSTFGWVVFATGIIGFIGICCATAHRDQRDNIGGGGGRPF